LGAREEFRLYLVMYAKRLGAEGMKGKVEELLRGLMGRVYEDVDEEDGEKNAGVDAGDGWMTDGESMVGWKRAELLREVVLLLGKHRDLQRITVPYARLLGALKGVQDNEAMVTDL